jgi:N-acetyl-gamma-glutamyl-phosphate reductase
MTYAQVALFGAGGYAGLELAKLLAAHPSARLLAAASDSLAGRRVAAETRVDDGGLVFAKAAEVLALRPDAALLAVPPEAATQIAPVMRAAGAKVIDLSNAYRASAEAVYGLTSLFAADVAGATLVANPGCYATCVITAVAPLVRHGLIERDVIVAAGSGVTGAGRKADEALGLGEMHGNVRAYRVLRHQHVPEIEMALGRVAQGGAPRVILTTHLLPIARGIFATINVRLRAPRSSAELTAQLRADYADDPTVVVVDTPEQVSLRHVVGTNQTHVGIAAQDDVCVVTAALDNLVKGAAGQAIENLNLVLGAPRLAGLAHLGRHG